jgi:hypothetical protein
MIENNLNEIAERLRGVTPANYEVDFGHEDLYLIINWPKEKVLEEKHREFFKNAAIDIAQLVIEVKQLRQINSQLKRQISNNS